MSVWFIAILAVVLGGVVGGVWAWKKYPPKDNSMQVNTGLLALGLALLVPLFQVPSISIDLSSIFSYASQILVMMMPIVGVGAGISFGFALVAYIIRLFRQVF